MVRLGYAGCRACHLAPQGAGLLTDYGKGIDQAQSLIADEYPPAESLTARLLRYDIRLLTSGSWSTATTSGIRAAPPSLLRLFLRNSVRLGQRNRLASTLRLEAPPGHALRLWDASPIVDATAAWDYRASDAFTLSVARDRLPRGIELGETSTILDDLHRDRFPTQVRAFIDSNRVHVTAYAFAPGSADAWDQRTRGGGALAEVQFFRHHVVVGISGRARSSVLADERTIGSYARLGFGRWGILTEHELTRRTSEIGPDPAPRLHAGYTQVFFAPWEWLVTSVTGEYSSQPGVERTGVFRWRPGVQARLSSNVTVTASARNDMAPWMDGTPRMYLVEIAIKTVQ
jgi:hypothetical protein